MRCTPRIQRDHTFAGALGSDPLDHEAQAKNQTPAEPNDLPRSKRDAEDFRFGAKLKAAHMREKFGRRSLVNSFCLAAARRQVIARSVIVAFHCRRSSRALFNF